MDLIGGYISNGMTEMINSNKLDKPADSSDSLFTVNHLVIFLV